MRLSALAVLAPIFALAAADYMVINTVCTVSSCNNLDGSWHSAYGTNYVDGTGGCQDPPYVPGMYELCIDWSRNRAHFYFDGQGKRCLVQTEYAYDPNCPSNWSCYRSVWSEVGCSW